MFVTDRHDMTLASKVALNPNETNNQLTFVDCCDKILLNSSGKTLLTSPKARLITFFKTRLIKFYLNSLLMTDHIYLSKILRCSLDGINRYFSEPFPKQTYAFICLQYKSFENTSEKGESTRSKRFLLFPTSFSTFLKTFHYFHQI